MVNPGQRPGPGFPKTAVSLSLKLSTPTRSVTMLTNEDDALSHLLTIFIEFLEAEFSALAVED